MRQNRVCVLSRRCKYRLVIPMEGQSYYAFSEKVAEGGSELWLQSACSLQCLLTAGVRSVHSSDIYNLISQPSVEFIALQTASGSFLSLIHFQRHGEEAITCEAT